MSFSVGVKFKLFLKDGHVINLTVAKPEAARGFYDNWLKNAANAGMDRCPVGFVDEFSVRLGDIVAIQAEGLE